LLIRKLIAILLLGLLFVTVPVLSVFSQIPKQGDCHAVILLKRFDVSRFNNDPALVELTMRLFNQELQEALGGAITVITEVNPAHGQPKVDFEVSGAYDSGHSAPSTLRVVLLNRKKGGLRSEQTHPFSSTREITNLVKTSGKQLAKEIFKNMDCKFGFESGPAEGQCYLLTFSGTTRDTVHALQDPIHGKMPGVNENESRKIQHDQGSTVFVVSSEVVDPKKYAHLATPQLVQGANQTLQHLRQHVPGAAQMEHDLHQVTAPADKPYQSIWGEGDYIGRLVEESSALSMGDAMMGSSVQRQSGPATGKGESHIKGKLVERIAYLELSGSATADVNAQASQKVQMGGQQSSVPWEPLLNRPGQKTSLSFSVPFKIPLQDGASTTIHYNPSVGMIGLGQGKFENQFKVYLKKLSDNAPECKRAKSIADPDKAMRNMLDMMGPGFGQAMGQMFQGIPQNSGAAPQGWQSPQGYQVQPPNGYQQPAYSGQQRYPFQGIQQPDTAPESHDDGRPGFFSPEGAVDMLRNLFGF
jgi:hypothetical protein